MGKLNKILAVLCLLGLVGVLFSNYAQNPTIQLEKQASSFELSRPIVTVVSAQNIGESVVINKPLALKFSENCQFNSNFTSANLVQNTGAVNLFQPSNCLNLVDKPAVLSAQVKLQVVNLPVSVANIRVVSSAVKIYSQNILPFVPRLPDAAAIAVLFGLVVLENKFKARQKTSGLKPNFLLKSTKNIFELEVMRC